MKIIKSAFSCVLALGLCLGSSFAQTASRTVHGTVRDPLGRVVVGARVTVQASDYKQSVTSAEDGSFQVEKVPQQKVTVSVSAAGFAPFVTEFFEGKDQVEVVLSPATVFQEINVTANRVGTSQSETAESVTMLRRQEMDNSAAEAVDEVLRQVPGFTLFRRSDSRTANPTSQGAFLRGVGASGASRTVVLYDDIPLNDPFGGWIYWGRIPRQNISSVEVLRGGGSSLYGSGALGGVVNVLPQRPSRNLLSAEFSSGSEGTPDFSLASGWQLKSWSLEGSGEVFRTAGYVLVPEDQRGAVDTPANSYHQAAQMIARKKLPPGDMFLGGSFYNEARNNGTVLQTNDTQLWQVSSGVNLLVGKASIQLRGHGSGQSYNQTFSSIALDRNSEALVRAQHVPAQEAGGSLTGSRSLGARNMLVAGLDGRYVRGFSNETGFAASLPTSLLASGGAQLISGAFLQDSVRLHSRLLLTVGGRYDNWDNYNAHSAAAPLTATAIPTFTSFADQSEHAFSPRAALLFNAGGHVTLTASAYRSFRAPMLNELYRSFRLGNVLTLANSQLRAERLSGAESGANLLLWGTYLHTTFFWMEVSDPVSNVTLATTPALVTRQRQNLGHTRSRGVEADAAWRFHRMDVTAGYQFVDAVVTSFPANRLLEGRELPQVAPHQFTFQTRYATLHGWTFAAQGIVSSGQFDDDLNQFPLDSFFQLDAYVSRRIHKGVEIFGAVENLLNSRKMIASTSVVNLGPPIYARVGFRLRLE